MPDKFPVSVSLRSMCDCQQVARLEHSVSGEQVIDGERDFPIRAREPCRKILKKTQGALAACKTLAGRRRQKEATFLAVKSNFLVDWPHQHTSIGNREREGETCNSKNRNKNEQHRVFCLVGKKLKKMLQNKLGWGKFHCAFFNYLIAIACLSISYVSLSKLKEKHWRDLGPLVKR